MALNLGYLPIHSWAFIPVHDARIVKVLQAPKKVGHERGDVGLLEIGGAQEPVAQKRRARCSKKASIWLTGKGAGKPHAANALSLGFLAQHL